MTSTDPAAARTVADESARVFQNTFTERLVAAYLLGSLAYGGYAPTVSDIDLAVILTDTRDGDHATIHTTAKTLHTQSDLHRKLSVFWASLPALRDGRDDGHFPALDRLQLADQGVLLLGSDVARQVTRPTAYELLLGSARFAIDVLATAEVIAEFRHPRRLLADPVWFSKAVLFPVRFLHTNTSTTRRAATNDEAIAWYLAQPRPTASTLVRLAQSVRAGQPLDPPQVAPALAAGLIPLYQRYIGNQVPLLRHANAPAELVTTFTHWGRRLGSD
jgi:hypothetical protein